MKILDEPLNDEQKAMLWQQRFFEAQAACEEYIMKKSNDTGIQNWIIENAKITAKLLNAQEPLKKNKTTHFLERIHKQLKCYDSNLEIIKHSEFNYEINNLECGILKYRLQAEKNGVRLTFKSPCSYCKKLNTTIALNYIGDTNISISENASGCKWFIQSNGDA
jgi:hypothetical protein